MSFSSEVKKELLKTQDNARHCKIALLAAFVNLCGFYDEVNKMLIFVSENIGVLEKASELIKDLTGAETEIKPFENHSCITVDNEKTAQKLVSMTMGVERDPERETINPIVVSSVCCKRAYIRGAFICTGSVSDPRKQYHLEFTNVYYEHAAALRNLILSFGIEAKIITRKNHYIVYMKEGEQIVDMLNIMSAHKALLEFENLRVVKDLRNNLNRIVNCETANLNKVVSAGVRQVEAIEYIMKTVGLGYLSESLQEMARVRLEYPDLSLKELGEKLDPAVGKSGVNHRLKKICLIAENLKGDM